MSDHLQLPDRKVLPSRRAGGSGGSGRPVRNPGLHGRALRQQVDAVLNAAPRVSVEGVDPRRVFKIHARSRLTDEQLRNRSLQFLGDTPEWSYIVVSTDDGAAALRAQLSAYADHRDPATTAPLASVMDLLESIQPYGREDRLTEPLLARVEEGRWPITVDAVLWPSASYDEARSRIDDVRRAAEAYDGVVQGQDYRPRSTVVRVRCPNATMVDALAELMVVERLRLPFAPLLEPSDWLTGVADDFVVPAPLDVVVGILDDGVTSGHPLLAGLIQAEHRFPTAHVWRDHGPHGTMVAGLAAYGGFEAAIAVGGALPVPVKLVVARILEPDGSGDVLRTHLPSGAPDHQVVEEAIRSLHVAHGVRVVNLSVTDPFHYSGPHVGVLTETLDRLARELDIVIVVCTGNRGFHPDGTTSSGLDALDDYPHYLQEDEARLAEPAPASAALTVGSLGLSDAPVTAGGSSFVDERAIARRNRPSPFTRCGPGASAKMKPEVVAHGGDLVSSSRGLDRQNAGVSVISLSHDISRLFRVASGTSYAAPRIANLAARILHRYPGASGNLIRALIALSAAHPPELSNLGFDPAALAKTVGAGMPRTNLAMESAGSRVVMMFEGSMDCDKAVIHPIPIPREFASGTADRSITVALAFSPPVRRQRREYLAGHIKMHLYRSTDEAEVGAVAVRQEDNPQSISGRRHVQGQLKPGSAIVDGSALWVRRWVAPASNSLLIDDGDAYYMVLSHFREGWAGVLDEPYETQSYAVCVELWDRSRIDLDLYNLVQTQVQVPARVRIRG